MINRDVRTWIPAWVPIWVRLVGFALEGGILLYGMYLVSLFTQ
jgi:hypothetical protein